MKQAHKNKMQKKTLQQKLAPPIGETYLNPNIFRSKTKFAVRNANFFLSQGGLGDYICQMPVFEFLAEQHIHIHGRIFCNAPFDAVANHIMKKYEHWTVHQTKEAQKIMKQGEMMFDPSTYRKYVSACGSHLMDAGFMYYANQQRAVDGYSRMPNMTGLKHPYDLPEKYIVLTPGATAKARTMPAKAFNELVNFVIEIGMTPVFLGKKDFAHNGPNSDYFARIDPEYDFSKGVDLTEKTSLLEAVAIIEKSQCVVGLDNGLLHFAGCTETPIVFGHTVASVDHRKIRRPKGQTINIALEKKSLPCIGCQSNMRFVIGHSFKYCIYDDYKCLDLLFKDDCKAWKEAIRKAVF